jgi:hypothetical protein
VLTALLPRADDVYNNVPVCGFASLAALHCFTCCFTLLHLLPYIASLAAAFYCSTRCCLMMLHLPYNDCFSLTHIVLTALLPRADDVYNNVLVRGYDSHTVFSSIASFFFIHMLHLLPPSNASIVVAL